MEYPDAALQPITVGDFIVSRLRPRRDRVREIVQFDEILLTPQFRGEDPRTQPRARYASKAHDPHAGTHVFPIRHVRHEDGSTAVEWAPYWAYRVQVMRCPEPGRPLVPASRDELAHVPERIAKIAAGLGMTDSVIQAFAKHLSGQFDEAGVARELSVRSCSRSMTCRRSRSSRRSLARRVPRHADTDPRARHLADHRGPRRDHGDTRPRGQAKTTMNLNRILRWGCGRPLYDSFRDKEGRKPYLAPGDPVKTLIIENEGSAGMFHHKMGVMLNNCGDLLTDEDRALIRENVMVWGDGGYSGLKLDNDGDLGKGARGVREALAGPAVHRAVPRPLEGRGELVHRHGCTVIDNILGHGDRLQLRRHPSHHERKSGAGEDGELMSAGRVAPLCSKVPSPSWRTSSRPRAATSAS